MPLPSRHRGLIAFLGAIVLVAAMANMTGGVWAATATQETDNGLGDADADLDSRDTFWAGQQLLFDGSEIVPNASTASEENRTFRIRRVTNGEVGALVGEIIVDTEGNYVVSSDDLAGEFVLRYRGETVYVQGGTGYRSSPPDGTPVTIENSLWEVTGQTLEATWQDPTVVPEEDATAVLELSSNRGSSTVRVAADGLDFKELAALFDESSFAEDHDELADDDAIVLATTAETSVDADFEAIATGIYTFTVNATDTTASSVATIEVRDSQTALDFSQESFDAIQGDTASFTVELAETETAFVAIGSPRVNVLEVLELTDQNGDGRVTVRINTRYVALPPGSVPADTDLYESANDSVKVYDGTDTLADGSTMDELRGELGIEDEGLSRPLDSGDYPLRAATSDDFAATDDGQLQARDLQDVSTLRLNEPTLDNVSVYEAPTARAVTDNVAELRAAFSPIDGLALEDRLVLSVNTTGVFGYLDARKAAPSAFQDEGEGIEVSIDEVISANETEPIGLNLSQEGAALLTDEPRSRVYVILDTSELNETTPLSTNESYQATIKYEGVDSSHDRYSLTAANTAASRGYPYLESGINRSVNATFSVVGRQATFHDLSDNGTLKLPEEAGVEVSGNSTLSPNTEVRVKLRSMEKEPFLKVGTVTTDAEGGFSATFDMVDGVVGQNFTAKLESDGDLIESVNGQVIEGAATGREPAPEEATEDNETAGGSSTNDSDTPGNASTPQANETVSGNVTPTASVDVNETTTPGPNGTPTATPTPVPNVTATPTATPNGTAAGPFGLLGPVNGLLGLVRSLPGGDLLAGPLGLGAVVAAIAALGVGTVVVRKRKTGEGGTEEDAGEDLTEAERKRRLKKKRAMAKKRKKMKKLKRLKKKKAIEKKRRKQAKSEADDEE